MNTETDLDDGGPASPPLEPVERERVLAASTELLKDNGPRSVTLKWVALKSGIPLDRVSGEWTTIEAVLADVLERLSAQMGSLADGSTEQLLGEGEFIDVYQHIVARCLLDGVNPASLLTSFPHSEQWAAILQEQFGLDERSARLRLCQVVSAAWGWRLFGPHIKIACGLPDEADETFTGELRHLAAQIIRPPRS
jgi:hypothetical protein